MMAKADASEALSGERPQAVSDLVDIAGRLRASSVIIPGGSRLEDLRLTDAARDNGIIDRIILVGKKDQVHRAVAESGMDIAPHDIVAVASDEAVAQATIAHMHKGEADIVLKGDISTPILNRAMLPLAERPTVSLVSVFDAAPIARGRPVILTDAGVTTVCNMGRMVDLIQNAVDVAQVVMGITRPRVAVLSANEKQIASLPSTWMGLELARRSWPDAVVCGPLSFDLATSEESVAVKGMPDLPGAEKVAGQADILVCPGIDAANILYKALTAMTRYGQASIAGITIGFPIPYIILSRADALETRLDSIALCSIYAQKRALMKRDTGSNTTVALPTGLRILAVNPGTTSIALALYEGERCVFDFSSPTASGPEQIERLTQDICRQLRGHGVGQLDAVCARGSTLNPAPDDALHDPISVVAELPNQDIGRAQRGDHDEQTVDPGRGLAVALARHCRCAGLVVDSGRNRRLRIRAGARYAARGLGRHVDQVNLLVADLGHELTIAGVRDGRIARCALASYGGDAQASGEAHDNTGLHSLVKDQGWTVSDERMAKGDTQLQGQLEDLVLHIAQRIGAAFVAADCIVEAIVLTGEWMQSAFVRNALRKRIVRLAPVQVYQGSMDLPGLAGDACTLLAGRPQPFTGYGKEIGRD